MILRDGPNPEDVGGGVHRVLHPLGPSFEFDSLPCILGRQLLGNPRDDLVSVGPFVAGKRQHVGVAPERELGGALVFAFAFFAFAFFARRFAFGFHSRKCAVSDLRVPPCGHFIRGPVKNPFLFPAQKDSHSLMWTQTPHI